MEAKDQLPKIEQFKVYVEGDEIISASAIINSIQHCTGDVRTTRGKQTLEAVFSLITADSLLLTSINECVGAGLYKACEAQVIDIHQSHYTYVEFKIN